MTKHEALAQIGKAATAAGQLAAQGCGQLRQLEVSIGYAEFSNHRDTVYDVAGDYTAALESLRNAVTVLEDALTAEATLASGQCSDTGDYLRA